MTKVKEIYPSCWQSRRCSGLRSALGACRAAPWRGDAVGWHILGGNKGKLPRRVSVHRGLSIMCGAMLSLSSEPTMPIRRSALHPERRATLVGHGHGIASGHRQHDLAFSLFATEWDQTPGAVQAHMLMLQTQLHELQQQRHQIQQQVDTLQGRLDKTSKTSISRHRPTRLSQSPRVVPPRANGEHARDIRVLEGPCWSRLPYNTCIRRFVPVARVRLASPRYTTPIR